MTVRALVCPQCGAPLPAEALLRVVVCAYCNHPADRPPSTFDGVLDASPGAAVGSGRLDAASLRSTLLRGETRYDATVNPRYSIVLIPAEKEGVYTVLVPCLPGCITEGRTIEEALAKAEVAIRSYLWAAREAEADDEVPPADEGSVLLRVIEVDLDDE